MGAQESSLGDLAFDLGIDGPGEALSDGPLRGPEVLRLHRKVVAHDRDGPLRNRAHQAHPSQALLRDIHQLNRPSLTGAP